MTAPLSPYSGGFLPTPQSPVPSNASTSVSTSSSSLPHPRSRPLRAGSNKEEAARRYVDEKLLQISRRYTKRYQPAEPGDSVKGYENFREVCKDLNEVVDVIWLSGTPRLQIPYLMNVALSLTTYLPDFPPSPPSTFALLHKMDHAFASLLRGEDIGTGDTLPGLEIGSKNGMSRTDMVRCKSLVESTRVLVVEVINKEPEDEVKEDKSPDQDTDMEVDAEGGYGVDDGDEDYEMEVARVYEHTIEQLNLALAIGVDYDVGNGS